MYYIAPWALRHLSEWWRRPHIPSLIPDGTRRERWLVRFRYGQVRPLACGCLGRPVHTYLSTYICMHVPVPPLRWTLLPSTLPFRHLLWQTPSSLPLSTAPAPPALALAEFIVSSASTPPPRLRPDFDPRPNPGDAKKGYAKPVKRHSKPSDESYQASEEHREHAFCAC